MDKQNESMECNWILLSYKKKWSTGMPQHGRVLKTFSEWSQTQKPPQTKWFHEMSKIGKSVET